MEKTYSINNVKNALHDAGYEANNEITMAVWSSLVLSRPLLLEGAPGTGKTSLSKALADGLGLPYIRLQMYDGLTDDKILYDYDYTKQLLTLEAVKPKLEEEYKGLNVHDAIQKVVKSMDFYGPDFLIKRPILKAITGDQRYVLCIDELDKAPEEIEYMLYEFLENYTISIPQYGDITCPEDKRPIVFITSNGYRELSDALRRRCNYLYIEPKTEEELTKILSTKVIRNPGLAKAVAQCFIAFQNADLHYIPSISEAIEYAEFLDQSETVTKDLALSALSIAIKNNRDKEAIQSILERTGAGAGIWQK